ncbi:MAG: ABC transporter substrate-binding protein [Burkholderiales bacterium]|nr:ABC transporter substrate-binding protein [Burkholderiales bacterium]
MNGLKWITAVLALAAAQGLAARELVIGQVAPNMQDPLLPGWQLKSGIELYLDAVNKAGGVHGNTVRLAVKDRGLAVADALAKTQALIDEQKPIALIGLLGTGPMEGLVKDGVVERNAIPIIGIRTGATSLHDPVNPWLFHTRANYADEAGKIVRHLSTIGLRRIAVFHENTAYGKETLRHTLAALEKVKVKPLAIATYEVNTTDVQSAVKALSAAAPDGVIAAGQSPAVAELFKGLQQNGANRVQMITFSTVDAATVVKLMGRIEARGMGVAQVVPDPANRKTFISREFQDMAQSLRDAKFELTQGAMEGFLAAKVLVEGLRKAGPNPTPGKLKAALEGLRNYDAGGVVINFSPKSHSGSSFVNIGILATDGKLMN